MQFVHDLTLDTVQAKSFRMELNKNKVNRIVDRFYNLIFKQHKVYKIPILTNSKEVFVSAFKFFVENIFNDLSIEENNLVTLGISEPIISNLVLEVL